MRRAISLALDREAAETGVDRAAAAALLDGAGWAPGPDGFRVKDGQRLAFTVMFLPNITTHRELALALRSD